MNQTREQQHGCRELRQDQPFLQVAEQSAAQRLHGDPHAHLAEQRYETGIGKVVDLPLENRLRLRAELAGRDPGRKARNHGVVPGSQVVRIVVEAGKLLGDPQIGGGSGELKCRRHHPDHRVGDVVERDRAAEHAGLQSKSRDQSR